MVEVTSNKDLVYFVMNLLYKNNVSLRRTPDSPRNAKAIILVDTLNNTAIHYETVKLMLQDLGLKSTGATSIVKRYMNPTKLYKQQYEFDFAEEYKGNITSSILGCRHAGHRLLALLCCPPLLVSSFGQDRRLQSKPPKAASKQKKNLNFFNAIKSNFNLSRKSWYFLWSMF